MTHDGNRPELRGAQSVLWLAHERGRGCVSNVQNMLKNDMEGERTTAQHDVSMRSRDLRAREKARSHNSCEEPRKRERGAKEKRPERSLDADPTKCVPSGTVDHGHRAGSASAAERNRTSKEIIAADAFQKGEDATQKGTKHNPPLYVWGCEGDLCKSGNNVNAFGASTAWSEWSATRSESSHDGLDAFAAVCRHTKLP